MKLGANYNSRSEVNEQPFSLRNAAIRTLARQALGLEISCDIADLDVQTGSELLFVMQTMRDAIFTEHTDDTMEVR